MADPVVPKFSSFKSKPAPPTAAPASCPSDDAVKDKGRSSRPSRRRSEHSSDHASDRKRQRRTRSPPKSDRALVRLERKPETEGPRKESDLFFLDRRGDPLISRYHANDRAKVPLYRRSGRGRVLGSPGFLVLHREGRLDEFSIRFPGAGPSALRDRHLFNASIRRMKPRRIKPAAAQSSVHEDDFVPLSSKSGRNDPGYLMNPVGRRTKLLDAPGHSTADLSQSSMLLDVPSQAAQSINRQGKSDQRHMPPEDAGPDYRSIEGKAKAHEFSDSELEYSSDEETIGIDMSDPMRVKAVELNRRVKEHPEDIDAWLSLIDHQDTLLKATEGTGGEPTQAEVLSYADIKLSMYESAMGHAKTAQQKERLLLGTLTEGAKVWPASRLDRRWEEALKANKRSFVLWKARLDSRLSDVKAFQYTGVRDTILDRLRQAPTETSFPSSPHPGAASTESQSALYEQLVYVFLRLTRYMYDSGFRELAVAAWQALLEVNLFRPPSLAGEENQGVLEAFRDFWESEAPRLGEQDAKGWAHAAQVAEEFDPPDPRTEDNEVVVSRDVYKSWGATEKLRAIACRHPARAMDEGNDDDPYRVVIFSDVEKLLFLIPAQIVPLVQETLVDGFMLFSDLPLLFGSGEWMKAAATDTHIVARSMGLEQDVSHSAAPVDLMEDQSKRKPDWSHEASSLAPSSDLMIYKDGWYNYLTEWVTRDKHQGGTSRIQHVIGVLSQLGSTIRDEKLAEYRLALEWHAEPTLVKKRAKALLKHLPSSRRLYTAYALAEFANGNADVARQILAAASTIPAVSDCLLTSKFIC